MRIFHYLMVAFALTVIVHFLKSLYDISCCDYINIYDQFIINYCGGYVRRGLIGSLAYELCSLTGAYPQAVLAPIIAISAVITALFFIYKFRRRRLCWYVLPLTIFLGLLYINTFDYLIISLFILSLYAYTHLRKPLVRTLAVSAITLVAMNVHETYLFYGVPVMLLCMFNDKKQALRHTLIYAGIALAATALVTVFHGDKHTAAAIILSWGKYIDPSAPIIAVDALGWDTSGTFLRHLYVNTLDSSFGLRGWYVRPFVYLLIYYVMTNVIFVFKRQDADLTETDRLNISCLLAFQFLFMLPLFTFLSCDAGRIVTYWTQSSYAVFLCIDRHQLKTWFPEKLSAPINRFNQVLVKAIPPKKAVIALLLLIVTITPVGFCVDVALKRSVIGHFVYPVFTLIANL